jgi:hypothetical protein
VGIVGDVGIEGAVRLIVRAAAWARGEARCEIVEGADDRVE